MKVIIRFIKTVMIVNNGIENEYVYFKKAGVTIPILLYAISCSLNSVHISIKPTETLQQ